MTMDVDARGLELVEWLEENWAQYGTSRGLIAAAMQTFRPPPLPNEQDWLTREWGKRVESRREAASSTGALTAAQGEASESSGISSGADPDTSTAATGPVSTRAAGGRRESESGPTHTSADAGLGDDVPAPSASQAVDPSTVVYDPETGEVLDEDIPFEVDGELAEEAGPSEALELRTAPLVSMFGPGGPEETIAAIERYAQAMRRFITDHDLALEMEDGSLYVTAPGVEAGGQMLGWFSVVDTTEQITGGFKARAHAYQPDTGRTGAARDAVATRSERGKAYKTDSDLISLAQTRACRKALNATLSIIFDAAGYDAADPSEKPHTPKQRAMLFALFAQLDQVKRKGKDGWKDWATQGTLARFGKRISGLNRAEMTETIERVKQVHEELTGSPNGDGPDPTVDDFAEAEGIEFG